MGGELRYGNYGFYCSNGRKHVFHHLFPDSSGTSMDIGPCERDACPFAPTHGSHVCQSCEGCLDTRRITLDSGRDRTAPLTCTPSANPAVITASMPAAPAGHAVAALPPRQSRLVTAAPKRGRGIADYVSANRRHCGIRRRAQNTQFRLTPSVRRGGGGNSSAVDTSSPHCRYSIVDAVKPCEDAAIATRRDPCSFSPARDAMRS